MDDESPQPESEPSLPKSPDHYVDGIIAGLNEQYDSNLGDDVESTAWELITEQTGSGARPISIAAGAVYRAAQIERKRVTQQQVATVAEIDVKTVRRNKDIK